MKICYCNPTILLKRPLAQVASKISKKHDVSVMTPRIAGKERHMKSHYSKLEGINVIDFPTLPFFLEWDQPIPSPLYPFRVAKMWRKHDIVHMWVPFYISSFTISLTKLLFFRKKKLILSMDTIPGYSFSMGRFMDACFKIYYRTLGKITFAGCDEIKVYGNSLKKYAKKAGMPMKKVKVLGTGIDLGPKKKTKNVRKELGIKKNMILFAGILASRKGPDLLIRVAEKVDAEFVLLGDGPQKKEYQAMVKEKKLKNVIFAGFRTDVHNFYREADVFFLPSRGEGLAGVIMEAMSYGVPVVSSDIPCTHDLVTDNGLLCPIESVDCYVKSINRILKSKKMRAKMSKLGKENSKKYDWNEVIKKYEALYVRNTRI